MTNCIEWKVRKEDGDNEHAVFMGAPLIEIINSGGSFSLRKYIVKRKKYTVSYIWIYRDLAICTTSMNHMQ